MTDSDRTPFPSLTGPERGNGQPDRQSAATRTEAGPTQETAGPAEIADAVADRIGKVASPQPADIPSVSQAIALREQAPEMYDLWLKIAQEKAATANYVQRAPYEVPERLAQSGRPRALGALVIVLSFCGYLAWLGGPGPYIGGLIAILDLGVMFGMFFGLRPERLPDDTQQQGRRRRFLAGPLATTPKPPGRRPLVGVLAGQSGRPCHRAGRAIGLAVQS
ncbi:MAG: hypothetical protein ACLQFR_14650 [Streptosporangiaceae bacterium]